MKNTISYKMLLIVTEVFFLTYIFINDHFHKEYLKENKQVNIQNLDNSNKKENLIRKNINSNIDKPKYNDTIICNNISELRNQEIVNIENKTIILNGYYQKNDLKSIITYYWDKKNNSPDDRGSIIKSNKSLTGRFIHQFDTINVANFGIFPNDKKITENLNELAVLASKQGKPLQFNSGKYLIQSDLNSENKETPNNLNKKGFLLPSNLKLINDPNTIFKGIPNSASNYSIITLHYSNNVSINSLRIIGDKDEHLGTNGEWGHGLFIVGSRNISIDKISVSDCWGDGLILSGDGELSGGKKGAINKNISINSLSSSNNRRQGLTISNGKNIIFNSIKIDNIKGISPESGIDFEPDYYYDVLQNINLKSVYTKNSANSGIIFSLQALNNKSEPIDIIITDFISYNERSFYIGGSWSEHIKGNISFYNFTSFNSPISAIEIRDYFNQPNLNFKNVKIKNPNQNERSDFYGSAILIYKDIDDSISDQGKIEPKISFGNVIISDSRKKMKHGLFMKNRTNAEKKFRNVNIRNIQIDGNISNPIVQ